MQVKDAEYSVLLPYYNIFSKNKKLLLRKAVHWVTMGSDTKGGVNHDGRNKTDTG